VNAIELLKQDHKTVDRLFQQVKATQDESEKRTLFEQISEELTVHAAIEEEIFYPRLIAEGDEELQDITKEGIQEHHQMKMFLREISELSDESEVFEPKLKVLIEDVEHHVMEEEGEMFKMVEEQFSAEVLEEIGTELEAAKGKFKKSAAA
jgi:hemerythrin-like domain-containing protein